MMLRPPTLGHLATVGAVVALAMPSLPVRAGSETLPSGMTVAERINARDEGETLTQTIAMELIDRHGKKRLRETRVFRKHYGDERRTLIFFLEPPTVRGTGFLTFDHPEPDRDDDQWLYLPAMRKVRRIPTSDRGGSFFGTDMTYEDMKNGSKVAIQDYTWKTVGEATVGGHACYLVAAAAIDERTAEDIGYSRVHLYVDQDIWMVRKAAYWDVRGNPLKDVMVSEIRQVQGTWTAHRIEAKSHKREHTTIFTFTDVDYDGDIDDDLFTERALQRGP